MNRHGEASAQYYEGCFTRARPIRLNGQLLQARETEEDIDSRLVALIRERAIAYRNQVFVRNANQHQDGEVATEDLEIMLKYMGCILALHFGVWTVGSVGVLASAMLDFAPLRFRF